MFTFLKHFDASSFNLYAGIELTKVPSYELTKDLLKPQFTRYDMRCKPLQDSWRNQAYSFVEHKRVRSLSTSAPRIRTSFIRYPYICSRILCLCVAQFRPVYTVICSHVCCMCPVTSFTQHIGYRSFPFYFFVFTFQGPRMPCMTSPVFMQCTNIWMLK